MISTLAILAIFAVAVAVTVADLRRMAAATRAARAKLRAEIEGLSEGGTRP